MGLITSPPLLLLLLTSLASCTFTKDASRKISVVELASGRLEVVPGHRVSARVVAWAALEEGERGWYSLEVSTKASAEDAVQARAAGVAEGYLLRNSIQQYYTEFFASDLCASHPDFCTYMREQISTNDEWVSAMVAEEGARDEYWHMVGLFYDQLDGITEGWRLRTKEQGDTEEAFDLTHGLRLINYIADVWDYLEKFKALEGNDVEKKKAARPSCSVLIKHLAGRGEVLVGHNTWHEYRAMGYRVLKKYNLPYRRVPGGEERVAADTISMSSWVGTIFSLDDFMTLSSGMVATETSLFIYNTSLYQAVQPTEQLFEPVRVMAASRLARSGGEWAKVFSRWNSGTYNNQWMVVDYSRVGEELEDGALTVLEQLPGGVWVADQTAVLRSRGYWASYNRAFYPEVFRRSGAQQMVDSHGSWFSYTSTPRARIFARDQGKVEDEHSMIKLMRYNDFQNDELAVVPGCPKPIPAGSIASRCDLTLPDSECSWQELDYMVGHQGYGALDMKMTSRRLAAKGRFWAVAGPPHGAGMPPFSWISTNLTSLPLYAPIQEFDFEPSVTQWTMEELSQAARQIFV